MTMEKNRVSANKRIQLLNEEVKNDRRYEEGVEVKEEFFGYNIYFSGLPSNKPDHRMIFSDARQTVDKKFIFDAELTEEPA